MTFKYISEEERAKIPADSFAGPNNSFPINTQAHVLAAAHLYGRAEDPEKVKANIIKIAKRKGFALPPEWQEGDAETKSADGLMIFAPALALKRVTGTNEVEGYTVLFSDPKTPDLVGTYFTKDTDFDIQDGDKRSLYFQHGFDEDLGNVKIGIATLTKDDKGVFIHAEIKLVDADKWEEKIVKQRQQYVAKILDLVDAGKLGYSSGAVSHLVRYEPVGDAAWIKCWPLGEASLTPNPAEPRTQAISVKTFADEVKLMAEGSDSEGGWTLGHEASMGALDRLDNSLHYKTYGSMYDHAEGRIKKDDLIQKHCDNCDAYKNVTTRLLTAMVPDDMDGAKSLRDLYAIAGDSGGVTYTKQADMLATAAQAFVTLSSRRQAVRAKSNRILSKDAVKALSEIGTRLTESVKQIEAITSIMPDAETSQIVSQATLDEIKTLAMQAEAAMLLYG